MPKVLVVYESVPNTTYVAKADMSDELYAQLKIAHGTILNLKEHSEEEIRANLAISWGFVDNPNHRQYADSELGQKLFGTLKNISGLPESEDLSDVTHMIHAGFYE